MEIMDELYDKIDALNSNDDDNEESDIDGIDDDIAEEITRDIVNMNDIRNKLSFNRCVLAVKSVRNRTITRDGGGQWVFISLGNKRFCVHNPPPTYSNDFVSLLRLWGVQIDDQTEIQGVAMFNMNDLKNRIDAFKQKY